jgi:hypothetical protein
MKTFIEFLIEYSDAELEKHQSDDHAAFYKGKDPKPKWVKNKHGVERVYKQTTAKGTGVDGHAERQRQNTYKTPERKKLERSFRDQEHSSKNRGNPGAPNSRTGY